MSKEKKQTHNAKQRTFVNGARMMRFSTFKMKKRVLWKMMRKGLSAMRRKTPKSVTDTMFGLRKSVNSLAIM